MAKETCSHRITIGFDPSISCTGVAVLLNQDLIYTTTIKTKPSMEMGARLLSIFDAFGYLETDIARSISLWPHPIERIISLEWVVAMETPFVGKSVSGFMKLSYIQALIYLWCAQSGRRLDRFAPMTVKQKITGKGNADKEEVARTIVGMYPTMKGVSHDITDAVAVALCSLKQG